MARKKNQLKRFNDAVLKWRRLLWLNNYDVTVRFADEKKANARTLKESHGEDTDFAVFGTTETLPDYQTAIIEVVEHEIAVKSDYDVDGTACHEMLHVLMGPFSDVTWEMLHELPPAKREVYKKWRRKAQEELVSRLTGIIMTLQRAPKGQV